MDIFLGSSQNWTIFSGYFLCILGPFLRVIVQIKEFVLVAKISFFWGAKNS